MRIYSLMIRTNEDQLKYKHAQRQDGNHQTGRKIPAVFLNKKHAKQYAENRKLAHYKIVVCKLIRTDKK